MKMNSIIKLFCICLVSCGIHAALTSCSKEDNSMLPASKEQMDAISGHWYTEVPISGETANWRTEEEGDMTTYDHIGVLLSLNGSYPDLSKWGYFYLKDNDMVNYGGIFQSSEGNGFDFRMDCVGNITPKNHQAGTPLVSDMYYDAKAHVITANVTYMGHDLALTFVQPPVEESSSLYYYWQMLIDEGVIFGYDDEGDHLKTDVTDKNAEEPSRARQF